MFVNIIAHNWSIASNFGYTICIIVHKLQLYHYLQDCLANCQANWQIIHRLIRCPAAYVLSRLIRCMIVVDIRDRDLKYQWRHFQSKVYAKDMFQSSNYMNNYYVAEMSTYVYFF